MTTTPATPAAPTKANSSASAPAPTAGSNPAAIPQDPLVRPDFSGRRLRLSSKPIPGYHLCWINDDSGNLESNVDMGYDFVTREDQGLPQLSGRGDDLGNRIRQVVGSKAEGSPLYAYLMKIPDLLFEEGMRSINDRNKAVQDSLRRTFKHAQGLGDSKDAEAFYADPLNKFQANSRDAPGQKR